MVLVQMHDGFGVCRSSKAVAARFELGAQLAVVINLAVEGDPDRLVFVGQRLMTAREVDDT